MNKPFNAKTDIWMPLYVADYLADTNRLTTIQHGAYLLLIMDYWRNGALPNDDSILAQIAKMPPDAWSITRAVLEQFFSITATHWDHKRIDQERETAGTNKKTAHDRAVKAAGARWGKEKDATSNASSNSQAMLVQCPSPSPSPLPLIQEQVTKKRETSVPDKFEVTPEMFYWATEQGLPEMRIKPETENFLDRCRAKDIKYLNWVAAWRTWIRNAVKFTKA